MPRTATHMRLIMQPTLAVLALLTLGAGLGFTQGSYASGHEIIADVARGGQHQHAHREDHARHPNPQG